MKTQPDVLPNRLWVYAVAIFKRSNIIVKYGDHRCTTYNEARRYATTDGNTFGKAQGLIESDPDVKILFVEDVTDIARTYDINYVEGPRKGFDNATRPQMPGKRKMHKNIDGGRSLELHEHPHNLTEEELKFEWTSAIQKVKNGGVEFPGKIYTGRNYLIDATHKITKDSTKHLLAGATGAGKETSTLALLVLINDIKKYNRNIVNVCAPTIPSTACELFEELSTVAGMYVKEEFVDFNRIVPYCVDVFAKTYTKEMSQKAQRWFNNNVTIVKSASDIPEKHSEGQVPVLFGSYPDIGLKSGKSFNPRYSSLSGRLGTLAIGEAHQFLSNTENKLWKNIKTIGQEFLLLITGTPYDFIFNGDGELFFSEKERSMFTRNDLYKDKNTNPNSDYKKYPDFIYYKIAGLFDEVVQRMKQDPRWKDDADGFTYQKFHTYDLATNKFKYSENLIWYYNRLFGIDEFGDGLNIANAPKLCFAAKRHGIVGLPTGSNGNGVGVYIPALVKLLVSNGALGNYKPLVAYENNLKEIKETVTLNETPTLTFTCIKHLTGANIPSWGHFVMLRPIGDSVKFFEQATGRIGRVSNNKTNCGVFLGDLEAAMNITVAVEEKISLERGENLSTSVIMEQTLNNFFFFNMRNGSWQEIEKPDLEKALEELSARGAYGVGMCIKKTLPPDDFNEQFKNANGWVKKKLDLLTNGNQGAKNSIKKKIQQLAFEFNKEDLRAESWNNMKKNHIARCRKVAYIKGFTTLQEVVDWVFDGIFINNNKEVYQLFGKGVERIPFYMLDPLEIDIVYTNRWINKLHSITSIDDLLEILEDKLLRDDITDFVAEPNRYTRRFISQILKSKTLRNKNTPITILDPCAGRGAFLIFVLKVSKELGIDIDPKNVYYNDVDPSWVSFFKQININYSLGIPEKNITCKDAITKDWNMKFTVVLGNPAYDASGESDSIKFWNTITLKSMNSLVEKNGLVAYTTPQTILKGTDATIKAKKPTYLIQKKFEEGKLHIYDATANDDFDVGIDICSWIWENSPNQNTQTEFIFEDGTTNTGKYVAASMISMSIKDQIIDQFIKSKHKKYTRHRVVQDKADLSVTETKKHSVPVVWNARGNDIMYSTKKYDARSKLCINNYKKFSVSGDNLFITTDDVSPAYFYITGVIDDLVKIQNLWNSKKIFQYVGNNYLNSKGVFLIAQRQNIIPIIDISREWTDEELYDEFLLTDEQRTEINNWYDSVNHTSN